MGLFRMMARKAAVSCLLSLLLSADLTSYRSSLADRINENLKDAVARLHALQDETALSRRRIRELEADLERARAEAVRSQRHADEVEQRNAVLETEKKGEQILSGVSSQLTSPRTRETRRRPSSGSRQSHARMARGNGTHKAAPDAPGRGAGGTR